MDGQNETFNTTNIAYTTCTEDLLANNTTYEVSHEEQPDVASGIDMGKAHKSVCLQHETSSFNENISLNLFEINVTAEESLQMSGFPNEEKVLGYTAEISDPLLSEKVFDLVQNDPQLLSPVMTPANHSDNVGTSNMELKLEDSSRLSEKNIQHKSDIDSVSELSASSLKEQKSMEISGGQINKTFEVSEIDHNTPKIEEVVNRSCDNVSEVRYRKPGNTSKASQTFDLSTSFSTSLKHVNYNYTSVILVFIILVTFTLMFVDFTRLFISAK